MNKRVSVVIDDDLVERVKKRYGLPTTRAAIDFALRALLPNSNRGAMLDLEGVGWDGNLGRLRQSRI